MVLSYTYYYNRVIMIESTYINNQTFPMLMQFGYTKYISNGHLLWGWNNFIFNRGLFNVWFQLVLDPALDLLKRGNLNLY